MKKLNAVIRAQLFSKNTVEAIFKTAKEMEQMYSSGLCPTNLLCGKTLVSLFYEPSTRTRLSFESAMIRLGGKVIGTENAGEFSSKAKGESLEDTIRVIGGYGDIIVLRYYKKGGAERAQKISSIPIINAGDGPGQHPTQALLDLYTIKKSFNKIDGLNIALVGDLLNGRTVRSLCYFLAKHYPNNHIYLVSPEKVKMATDITNYLRKYKVNFEETNDLASILPKVDVVYQTRVQAERLINEKELYKEVQIESKKLIINTRSLRLMKKNAIIMHPLPRITEISYAVDKDPRALYFQQAQNGLYIRMALLKMILSGY